jgi:hypothetical protein
MTVLPGALAGINRANADFWRRQRQRSHEQLTNDVIRRTAFDTLQGELLRQVPLFHRLSLEQALENAERGGQSILAAQARKGGSASKTDALQQLIDKIVARHPDVSLAGLIAQLRACRTIDTIDDIDEDTIWFANNGHSKQASLSGLKDRLSRAKKKRRSR